MMVSTTLALSDRGLHYGDGVFETMAVIAGRVRLAAPSAAAGAGRGASGDSPARDVET